MTYEYKMKGTFERPTHLFRYPSEPGAAPDFLGRDGNWHEDAQLLRFEQGDLLGADDITPDEARRVAVAMGMPSAVPA